MADVSMDLRVYNTSVCVSVFAPFSTPSRPPRSTKLFDLVCDGFLHSPRFVIL